jgi:hypothetical protein
VDARSQKPSIAAILMVGTGILDIIYGIQGFTAKVPATDLPVDFSGLILFCSSLVFVMGLIVLAGAYMAFKRGSFTLTVVATVAGMLGLGVFYLGFLMSLIALVLVALSRDEFEE